MEEQYITSRSGGIVTGEELIEALQPANPDKRFAVSRSGDTVGVWSDEKGRFVPTFGALMGNRRTWGQHRFELLANGRPIVPAEDWIEHTAEVTA